MEWARTHPYLSALSAAGALLALGLLIVNHRVSTPAGGSLKVWGGGQGSLLDPTSYTGGISSATERSGILNSGRDISFIPLSPEQLYGADTDQTGAFDMSAFIAALTEPAASTPSTQTSADLSLAYTFIPQGLVATTSAGPRRSPLQESLYQYGNDAGSYISTYEDSHRNVGQILTDQIQDRQHPQKAQAVRDVGSALQTVGEQLQGMEAVPSLAASAHAGLAQSYIDIGAKLTKVPDAQRDSDFIAAIETYNAAAEQFARKYVALASVFPASGVSFSPQDPGSVFMFTAAGGL